MKKLLYADIRDMQKGSEFIMIGSKLSNHSHIKYTVNSVKRLPKWWKAKRCSCLVKGSWIVENNNTPLACDKKPRHFEMIMREGAEVINCTHPLVRAIAQ